MNQGREGTALQSDLELATEAAAGHAAAFELLVRRHQAAVRGLARRLTGGAADADDIAQAAFLSAWRHIRTYAGGSFKAWLCAIAYREFLQLRRRRRDEVSLDETAHVIAFDRSAVQLDNRLDLTRALAQLSEPQRVCVSLCVAAGLSHREAAEITQWPLGTVKSHVTRGVAAMRKQLAPGTAA